MEQLTGNSVPHAIEDKIRKWIPSVTIIRPWSTGGSIPIATRPLNVFRNTGGRDTVTDDIHNPNNKDIYPFIFIEQLSRTRTHRQRVGAAVRYFYQYLISVRYYIDINPLDLQQIPLLQEELDKMDLMLERVLQEIDVFGGVYPTQQANPTHKEAGVLHTFLTVEVSEDTVALVYPKIEHVNMDISLNTDTRDEDD